MTKLQEAETMAQKFIILEKKLQEFLDNFLNFRKKMDGEVSVLKDNMVDTSNIYFERENEHVAFFHLTLYMTFMGMFKVSRDVQLVDDKLVPSLDKPVTSLVKDAQIVPS